MTTDMIMLFNTFINLSKTQHVPVRFKDMSVIFKTFVSLYQEFTEALLPWANKIQAFLNGDDYNSRDAKYSGVSWKHHAFDVLEDYIPDENGNIRLFDCSERTATSVCIEETWNDYIEGHVK